MVLLDHFIDNGVHVGAFPLVLLHGLGPQVLAVDHLLLDVALQGVQLLLLLEGGRAGVLVRLLLPVQVLDVDVGVLLLRERKKR